MLKVKLLNNKYINKKRVSAKDSERSRYTIEVKGSYVTNTIENLINLHPAEVYKAIFISKRKLSINIKPYEKLIKIIYDNHPLLAKHHKQRKKRRSAEKKAFRYLLSKL